MKWICADVIEYKSARVCVAKDTGLVYSSPYIGLKIRNVMPEQAEAERPEGPTEDELEAAGLGYPLHKEEAVKLWYSGFRSEVITVLEAWEAIGHDTGINPDKEELLDSLRYMLEKCEAHDAALAEVERLRESKGDPSGSFDRCMKMMYERDENAKRLDAALARVAELEKGTVYVEARQCDECQHVGINDSADGLAACHDCDWTGPEPDEDKCPDCQRENCMAAACPQCGARYVLVASEEIAAPVAQAQHSVPEGFRELLEMLVASDLRKIRYAGAWRREVHDRASSILALLAAAPGMEVPQAWLDVQAERRRQVEAEGWTPEHDDEHACDEIAAFACFYAMPPAARDWDTSSTGYGDTLGEAILPEGWEPKTGDRRREMVKACALTLAEIERLDRARQGGRS
ncbi:hypothetical protein ACEOIK_06580 [Pseudomonas aeruginosa]|uniref:hypothetical protein n=1 Tax=Pseudomonas aeruginosa TaxID=287 RepID=UPI001CA50E02|nr:hypothetical protein [Pseudomonas aeruginosa]